MRPSKHPSHAITMMREMLDCGIAAGCYTDFEILFKVNDALDQHENICHRTFRRYKAAAMAFGELEVEQQQLFDPIYQSIYKTIIRSQIQLKENLINAIIEAPSGKARDYKWILERKFPEFNQRIANKRVMEQDAQEKQWMDEDLAWAQEAMQAPMPVPAEKPYKQQIFEREVREELQGTVPENEVTVFNEYWDGVQQEWDTTNPLQPGHLFSKDLEERMLDYYRNARTNWKGSNAVAMKDEVAA